MLKYKKKIVFRANGNAETGLGHLYRIFALVEMLKTDYEYLLLISNTSNHNVIPDGINFKIIPEEITIQKEPEWLSEYYNPNDYIIIADGYQFNSNYQKNIKNQGYKLIYIDDLASEYMYADVVINHSPHVKKEDFKTEAYTKFALGTNYAILRPSFLKMTKQSRIINAIDTAFVCFGGADYLDLTIKAVKALIEIKPFKNINVVLGGAYKHTEILDLAKLHPNKISVYRNLSEKKLLQIMQKCNFAIAPASTILYELCCIKMPVLSGYYVDNQKLIYLGFLNNKAIYKGENMKDYTVLEFKNKIKNIVKTNDFELQIKAQKILFDDKIASRHIKNINTLC